MTRYNYLIIVNAFYENYIILVMPDKKYAPKHLTSRDEKPSTTLTSTNNNNALTIENT